MSGLNPISSKNYKKGEILSALRSNDDLILFESLKFFADKSAVKNLEIQFGFEIEFYVRKVEGDLSLEFSDSFLNYINKKCLKFEIFDKIEPERGVLQFEIKTKPSCDVNLLIEQVDLILLEIKECCRKFDVDLILDAKPFDDDCGNAFQVNFSLNKNNENIFVNRAKIADEVADFLTNNLDELFVFCGKSDEDFARYNLIYNQSIFKVGKFVAPTAKSWGYDNRTCAVRILNSKIDKSSARIELRIPSNNLDKKLFLSAVILLLGEFLTNDSYQFKTQAIYGNSFDEKKYNQLRFPMSFQEALDSFIDSWVCEKMRSFLR